MIARILATAVIEFRIALRNRWVAIAVVLMVVFSLVLAAGGVGANRRSGGGPAVGHCGLADLAVGLSGAAGGAADVVRRRGGRGRARARCPCC